MARESVTRLACLSINVFNAVLCFLQLYLLLVVIMISLRGADFGKGGKRDGSY